MKRALLHMLGWYQQYRALQPSACRYLPTCSAYAIESVEHHGSIKGLYFATRRVLRCHPLGGHGYDPVPSRPVPSHPTADVRNAHPLTAPQTKGITNV